MHPRLQELMQYTEAQREELWAALATVPEPLRDRRPDAETWSVAEVLEHLHLVEQGIARVIGRQIEKAAGGLPPEKETTSLLQSLDGFDLLDRDRFMAVPDFVRPLGELSASDAVAALNTSRNALRAAVAAGNGLALGTVSFPHVRLGPLTLYQWVLFVGQHECRHAAQIREIGAQLGSAR